MNTGTGFQNLRIIFENGNNFENAIFFLFISFLYVILWFRVLEKYWHLKRIVHKSIKKFGNSENVSILKYFVHKIQKCSRFQFLFQLSWNVSTFQIFKKIKISKNNVHYFLNFPSKLLNHELRLGATVFLQAAVDRCSGY